MRIVTTELYYISGDRALVKKVWQKTWRISFPKELLRSLDSCCQPLTMAQVLVGTEFTPPPDTTLTFEGARTSKRGKIVLKASVTARICRICTSTIFCCSIRDKIQTMLTASVDHLHRQTTA